MRPTHVSSELRAGREAGERGQEHERRDEEVPPDVHRNERDQEGRHRDHEHGAHAEVAGGLRAALAALLDGLGPDGVVYAPGGGGGGGGAAATTTTAGAGPAGAAAALEAGEGRDDGAVEEVDEEGEGAAAGADDEEEGAEEEDNHGAHGEGRAVQGGLDRRQRLISPRPPPPRLVHVGVLSVGGSGEWRNESKKGKKETEGSSKVFVKNERSDAGTTQDRRTDLICSGKMQATGVGVILGIVPSNPPVFYLLAADPTPVATAALAGHLFGGFVSVWV